MQIALILSIVSVASGAPFAVTPAQPDMGILNGPIDFFVVGVSNFIAYQKVHGRFDWVPEGIRPQTEDFMQKQLVNSLNTMCDMKNSDDWPAHDIGEAARNALVAFETNTKDLSWLPAPIIPHATEFYHNAIWNGIEVLCGLKKIQA